MKILNSILLLISFSLLLPASMLGQGTQTQFGKNRIQYHDFEWWEYESRNFITYWYRGGQNIGQSVVQLAELDYNEIRVMLEYRINDKIEILVYTDLTDLKQSNIGSEEVFYNVGGVTKIVGNKIFVYFNGDHTHLRRQVREGIAQVYLNHMMFGSNLQEIVQNAVLLNLPEWFTDGLVSYIGEPWNTEMDNRLRDIIQSEQITSFTDLINIDQRFAGHAFWYFIAQNYGKSTVSNLLYLTRINRSVESGFLYVLGNSFQQTTMSWLNFYKQRYAQDKNNRVAWNESNKVTYKNKRNTPISTVKISPNGKELVYITNEIGKYKIYLHNLQTQEQTLIFKGGSKNLFQATDYNYPIVAWTPSGQKIGIIHEKRDVIKLTMYDVRDKKEKTEPFAPKFDRILDADFIDNRQMVVAALDAGYSDLFLYDVGTRSGKQLTKDYHDDRAVTFVKIGGRKGIIFASNRRDSLLRTEKLDTLLPINTFDLYYLDLEIKGNKDIVRLTDTPLANESNAVAINDRYFGFVSNINGIANRQIGYIDTVFAYNEQFVKLKDGTEIIIPTDSVLAMADELIDTAYVRAVFKPKGFSFANTNMEKDILQQHTSPRTNQIVALTLNQGKYEFYLDKLDIEMKEAAPPTEFQKQLIRRYEGQKTTVKQPRKVVKPIDNTKPTEIKPIEKQETPINQKPKSTTLTPVDTVPITLPKEVVKEQKDTGKVDIENYFFQSEFEDDTPPKPKVKVTVDENPNKTIIQPSPTVFSQKIKKDPKVHKFRRSRIRPYQTAFRNNYLTFQFDNNTMFGGRDPFANAQSLYEYPDLSILLMGSVVDLFEDYRLEGGVRIPTTFNGAEYFVTFNDLSKRLDKRYSFYRRAIRDVETRFLTGLACPNCAPAGTFQVDDVNVQTISNLVEVELKWPLDIYTSVRGRFMGRTDREVIQANNFISLEQPAQRQQRVGFMLEYVFDNTLEVATNIKNGTRYKAFAEVQKRFSIDMTDNGLETDFTGGLLGNVGVDARHYQRLDRHSIFAARFAAATSFGSEKILYYLGGVDNWLIPQFNTNVQIPQDPEYAYQTIATNMRGFRSNIRNGSSYAVTNLELRVPLLKYLSPTPIKSSFLRNFQVVGFFDIGTAWEGISPFDDDNPLNTIIIENPNSPVTVQVNYFRDPIVAGYGFGARSTIFGYFVRLDYAWGIETGIKQDPVFYFSLGLDF